MNIQDSYNEWSDIYDSNINLTRDLDSTVTRNLLGNRRFESILEIGCGTGKNTAFLAQIGGHVHALDFSAGMLAKAREKVKAGNVRFETADLTKDWPCRDRSYNLIVCCLVLEHIKDISPIFSEALRVLKPNGKFLINELHPFKQYGGTKARFERADQTVEVEAFVHHISEFIHTAEANGLLLERFNEYWHEQDPGKSPRLASFTFTKG
ncbi:MAG: class I SAM-dependent methyltransferase [Chloroflexi bacterium]|nr:class I SAM-dependent methyltransferase [Chloroflexota bacterium]